MDKYIDLLESTKLLPHTYKRIGYLTLILSVPFVIVLIYTINTIWNIENSKRFWGTIPLEILSYLIAIGLSLLVFSKEKIEDEMVQALRFKSFVYGVYLSILALFMIPFAFNVTLFLLGATIPQSVFGGHINALNLLLFNILSTFRVRIFMEKKRS